jgi:hypothetical protein
MIFFFVSQMRGKVLSLPEMISEKPLPRILQLSDDECASERVESERRETSPKRREIRINCFGFLNL